MKTRYLVHVTENTTGRQLGTEVVLAATKTLAELRAARKYGGARRCFGRGQRVRAGDESVAVTIR